MNVRGILWMLICQPLAPPIARTHQTGLIPMVILAVGTRHMILQDAPHMDIYMKVPWELQTGTATIVCLCSSNATHQTGLIWMVILAVGTRHRIVQDVPYLEMLWMVPWDVRTRTAAIVCSESVAGALTSHRYIDLWRASVRAPLPIMKSVQPVIWG